MARREVKARYRRWRDDRFGHEKTGGMMPTSYFLEDLAAAQNILGVLQQSPRAIAKKYGDVPPRQIITAIEQLVERRIAHWWPDIETLWVVEVLDEQSDGPKVDIHAAKLLPTLPLRVQAAIRERYGARVDLPARTLPDRVSDGGSSPGIRNQEQESGSLSPTTQTGAVQRAAPERTIVVAAAAPPSAGTRSGRVYAGRIAGSGEIAELDVWRRTAVAELPATERARVPGFTRDVAELGPGLAAALDEHGAEAVREVVTWAVRECAAGRLRREHFVALFNGDAFTRRIAERAVPARQDDDALDREYRAQVEAEKRRRFAEGDA